MDSVIINPAVAGAVRSLLGAGFGLPINIACHRGACPGPGQPWHHGMCVVSLCSSANCCSARAASRAIITVLVCMLACGGSMLVRLLACRWRLSVHHRAQLSPNLLLPTRRHRPHGPVRRPSLLRFICIGCAVCTAGVFSGRRACGGCAGVRWSRARNSSRHTRTRLPKGCQRPRRPAVFSSPTMRSFTAGASSYIYICIRPTLSHMRLDVPLCNEASGVFDSNGSEE